MDVQQASEIAGQVFQQLRSVIVGQDAVLREVIVALLAGGHALIEGVPGTAKTLIARSLAIVSGVEFRRIQFTPDLMPSDILGVNTYNTATGEFAFRAGPVFADVILADEINRTPAKTQSALLEAMQERQVSIDGQTHPTSKVLTVLATQNPVEFEGTYPLPEAQLDRFMLKILIDYPQEQQEQHILDRAHDGFDASKPDTYGLSPLLNLETLQALRDVVSQLRVEEMVRRYITQIVRVTRDVQHVILGASPRAAVMLMQAARAHALLLNRTFVTPDDVKAIALPVLRHRLLLTPEVEIEGQTSDQCIRQVLQQIPVPR